MNNTGENLFYFTEHSHVAAEQTGYSDYSYWRSVIQTFLKKKGSSIYDGPVCGDCGVLLHSPGYREVRLQRSEGWIRHWHLSIQIKTTGLVPITWDGITGARYGMQRRFPLNWLS